MTLHSISIGDNIAYVFDCFEKVSQSALQDNLQRLVSEPFKITSWIASSTIGTIQTIATMALTGMALDASGVGDLLIVRTAIASLILPILLRPHITTTSPNLLERIVIHLGDHAGTITHSMMIVSWIALAAVNRTLFPLVIAASLAFGLADRAKLINPLFSKVVDWTRFASLEYQIMMLSSSSIAFPVVGVALFALKIYPSLT